MIVTIYLLLIIVTLLLTGVRFKTCILPNTIFSTIWCVGGILAYCNNLGLIKPSIQIHGYIIASVITFNLIYFLFSNNVNQTKSHEYELEFDINYKLIIIFSIIGLFLILPNTIVAIRTLLSTGFSFASVRSNYAALSYSGRFFYVFFTNNIPIAIFGATSLIAAIDLANNKRKLLMIAIIGILIGTITFGGRYLILNFIIYYISAYLILKKYRFVKMRKSYIVIAIIILASITLLRGTSGLSVLDMGVLYYVGSFSYLEVILSHPDLYGLLEPPMFGYLTFGFLLEPFVLALKLILAFDIDVPSYYFNIYAQPFVNIGEYKMLYYNNNTTMLYTFIRDFGEIGVLVGTALIAIVVCIIQKSFEKKRNVRALSILVLLYALIVNSTMVYNFTSVASSLLILILLVFSNPKKHKKE